MLISFASMPTLSARLSACLLAASLACASMLLVHADAPPKVLALTLDTNRLTAAPAPQAPPAPKLVVPNLKLPKLSDDDDDDDAGSVTKVQGHNTTITINGHRGYTKTPLEDILIPLAGILGTFGTPILIVFFVFYFRYRRRRENLQLAREFLNKGVAVPPQLLDDSLRRDDDLLGPTYGRGCSDRRRGIKLLAIGLGVSLALYFDSPRSHDWCWGLILIVMGLGYLFSGWIEARQSPTAGGIPPTGRPPQ